jgi:hypothetical protein
LPDQAATPKSVLFDGVNLWVAMFGLNNYLVRIDPISRTVTGTVAIGAGPDTTLAFDGTTLWATRDTDTLRIDPVTLQIKSNIPTGHAYGIAFDGTSMWIGIFGGLFRVDPVSLGIQSGTSTQVTPNNVVVDGRYIWAIGSGNGNPPGIAAGSQRVDPLANPVSAGPTVEVPNTQGGCYSGNQIWLVTNLSSGNVVAADPLTLATVRSLPASGGGTATRSWCVFDGINLWAGGGGSYVAKYAVVSF